MTTCEMKQELDKQVVQTLRQQQKQASSPFHFFRNKDGKVKRNSLHNIEEILEKDPNLKGCFRYNDFTNEVDVVADINSLSINKGYMRDDYYSEIASYIENHKLYGKVLFDENKIRSALLVVARHHHYNPIVDYMNDAYQHWDHKERLSMVLYAYLGVEVSEITTYITKLFFVGVVAKVFNPKTKFDYVLDLVGGQGAGKTTFLQKIAPLGYYTDQFTSFDNKDDFAVMRRALIINDDEMTATANSSFETLKKFITLQEFEYRKPYGHQAERFAKHFVMARTTNELYYLKDKTGERRFLPVLVNKKKQVQSPVENLSDQVVKQLWGEAVSLYFDKKFNFKISEEMAKKLDQHRESFMYTDEIEDRLSEAMENELSGLNFITSKELGAVLDVDLTKEHKVANRVAYLMINVFGFRKGVKKSSGKTIRGYIKKLH